MVDAQLAALQHVDDPYPDAGLEVVFAYASPGNKRATGPLADFIGMLHNPLYATLLGFQSAHRGDLRVEGDAATVQVLLVGADGRTAGYQWLLTRQASGPYRGCWMTDGVARI